MPADITKQLATIDDFMEASQLLLTDFNRRRLREMRQSINKRVDDGETVPPNDPEFEHLQMAFREAKMQVQCRQRLAGLEASPQRCPRVSN
eukprot:NODE_1427_length_448_cov_139.031153_g1417_i0.p1 GENE.NODE_1427_length_448_cov_139.031153_g1417_i0~~NODE_1427_length_448_cov_139.031153_g1417_i0.p1  ORF type:complete len:91 (+),score=11.51 NODE_1427_length_448_cov_139.031153_g1417_i0:63-335(+)